MRKATEITAAAAEELLAPAAPVAQVAVRGQEPEQAADEEGIGSWCRRRSRSG